jgi:glutamate N-acetyltransferase/amino-acid N-acetyltransferase
MDEGSKDTRTPDTRTPDAELALLPVPGVRIGTAAAGVKHPERRERDDLCLFALAEGSVAHAVFTRNAFCAAPVTLARQHLAAGPPRYLLINAGNANAGTGEAGLAAARATCAACGRLGGSAPEAVLPFSTGVIGVQLPAERIAAALPTAFAALAPDGWGRAARAIMTTDTRPKGWSRQYAHAGQTYTLSGIAKGAGMIRPDMATMLAFLATDAPFSPEAVALALTAAVERSFNRITVDGDTSTNDACCLVATGATQGAGATASGRYGPDHPGFPAFAATVAECCLALAQEIVRDGEGATKFVTVTVRGGAQEAECLAAAYAIAHSPLVKTAFFASDPNWGRILAAVGRAGIPGLQIVGVSLWLDGVNVLTRGEPAPDYREAAGKAVLSRPEFTVTVDLGRGAAAATVWTGDLSHDYVTINAEYRT